MSRTQRLFDLIQTLRRYRYPVSGKCLASELDISLRTLYRDIATLQTQGALIEGKPELKIAMSLMRKQRNYPVFGSNFIPVS